MTEFKDFSLPELYQTPSPQAPGEINWKSVAVYGGIAVVAVVISAAIISHGYKSTAKFYVTNLKDIQKQHSEDLAKRDKQIEILFSKVLMPKLGQQTEAPNESQS